MRGMGRDEGNALPRSQIFLSFRCLLCPMFPRSDQPALCPRVRHASRGRCYRGADIGRRGPGSAGQGRAWLFAFICIFFVYHVFIYIPSFCLMCNLFNLNIQNLFTSKKYLKINDATHHISSPGESIFYVSEYPFLERAARIPHSECCVSPKI